MKKSMLLLTAALVCLSMTGCASKDDKQPTGPNVTMYTVEPNGGTGLMPDATDGAMPDAGMDTLLPGGSAGLGVTSVENARRMTELAEDELERLSEVTDAQVMVVGNTAIAALRFDSQYGSGVDERMTKMVEERVKGVVNGVDRVYVTGESGHFDTLTELGDRLEKAMSLDELRDDFDRLIAQLTPTA